MTKVLAALRNPCTQNWALRATPQPSDRCFAVYRLHMSYKLSFYTTVSYHYN
jgi:hypothetical protein